MQSKHERAYVPEETSAAKRLRLNVTDLFASNTVTGKRTQELLNDAAAGGVNDCTSWRTRITPNTARDLRRKMLKKRALPTFYDFEVTSTSPRSNKIKKVLCESDVTVRGVVWHLLA